MSDTLTTTEPGTQANAIEPEVDERPSAAIEAPPIPGQRSRLWRAGVAALWALVGFGAVVTAWQVLGPEQLPTPGEVFSRLRADISDPFYDAGPNDKGVAILLWASLRRVSTGFVLAVLAGVPLGLLMGTSKRWWQAANPVVQLFRPVSPLAWFPVWATWFMDSDRAATWVIFLTALWPVVLNSAAGAASVPADHRNVARVFRFSKPAYLRHVLVPSALPAIATGLRVAFGIAWVVIVAVEMLGTVLGIGNDTWIAYNGRNLDQMMANIFWIGSLGLLIDLLFLRLIRALTIETPKA